MRIEYMKNMLIDRLIGLDYIYPSDFITKMKDYISDEEKDIEKLKDLDGFDTDRVYLDYFKNNIQEKLAEQSMSIFEVKNMIKNSSVEGVGEKERVYLGRDFSYRGGFNSGVVEKDIVKVKVADTYKNANSYLENEEDEIDIDLNDEDSIDSDSLYDNEEDDSDSDEIDINLEEDDLEEDDFEEDDFEEEDLEEEDETDIDLGDDEDEIDINLEEDDSEEDDSEEDEDDSEEEDEIDINLEEDEDDIDFDYEDNTFSGDDSDEDEIDIDLEEEDEDDTDLEEDEEDGEDDIDIDLREDDSDDTDIDLEDDEDIDVNLEDGEDDIDTMHSNTPKPKENKQQHENRVKEKVFNNNFSNNTWDILNGAVDGVSNFFKRK